MRTKSGGGRLNRDLEIGERSRQVNRADREPDACRGHLFIHDGRALMPVGHTNSSEPSVGTVSWCAVGTVSG